MTEVPEEVDPFFSDEATGLVQEIQVLSAEFDAATVSRHKRGAEKYGPAKFLTVDTIEEALAEIVDLANYARYTYIRLRLLQQAIADGIEQMEQNGFEEHAEGFTKSKDSTRPRRTL